MNIDIKLTDTENDPTLVNESLLTYGSLATFKHSFENDVMLIDNISFDVDTESLRKLEFISLLDYEIEFRDSYNNTLSLSGSEIKTLLPTIKNNLGIRYNIVNKVYNDLKNRLDNQDYVLEYNAVSCFHESLYDTTFTQNIYDDIKENGLY